MIKTPSNLPHKILLLFVDGWGLASPGKNNPFAEAEMPNTRRLWGGFTSNNLHVQSDQLLLGLDATFGIEGLPQSATGQAALFTGKPVPRMLGEHRPGLPGPEVTALIQKSNLFTVAYAAGAKPTFANTYTKHYLALIDSGQIHPSCTTVMCRMVPGGLRFTSAYRANHAISHDITGEWLHSLLPKIKTRTPWEAGAIVSRLLSRHRLVLFEHFRLDSLAHAQNIDAVFRELARYDEFLGGVLTNWDHDNWLIIVSDHGNVEDFSTASHTKNPALLAGYGRGVGQLGKCREIAKLGKTLIHHLSVEQSRNTVS